MNKYFEFSFNKYNSVFIGLQLKVLTNSVIASQKLCDLLNKRNA